MTDAALHLESAAAPSRPARRKPGPIVPPQNLAGKALVTVIAIMTFLSSLTLGAVSLVRDQAAEWESQISREATIQIKPADGLDMEAALAQAAATAESAEGVTGTRVVDREATARLLEPWLGSGLNIDELPVPRLVIVTIDPEHQPDFAAIRARITADIPSASLDDHRTWVDRLVAMARMTVLIGVGVLALILAATVLSVIFATRGAMAGNGHIIEVLHFVGAESRFIARQFRRHFFLTGIKGAAAGGFSAALAFVGFSVLSSWQQATPEADQATALFGDFAIGLEGYAGVALIMMLTAALTALTTHLTVVSSLTDLDTRQSDG
jgi:cell division transport system permease protein